MKSIGLLCIAMLFLCGAASAERTIWYVHPDSALNTIQAGLDSCADNDIVLVGPGTYYENIVWPNTQGIHLVSELGPEMTVIEANSLGSIITCHVNVSNTILGGFTIQGGWNIYPGAAILITGNSSFTIQDNIVTNDTCAFWDAVIFFGDSVTVDVINNTICNNNGTGIHANGSATVTVDGNTINYNISEGCIDCDTIRNSTIAHNGGHGVWCYYVPSNIHFCDIYHNGGCGVRNDVGAVVNAENNWWGDPSGPYHPTANPTGLGDSVSDYVDFDPWLSWPVGVEEQPIVKPVETHEPLAATIFRGPLQLPEGKKCKVFDITGRVVEPERIAPGIYFVEIDNKVVQKVVKIR